MITYKRATDAEAKDIERMAVEFFNASPYARLGVDADRVADLVSVFCTDTDDKLCLCLMDGTRSVGVLGAVAIQNIFNKRFSCVEMMFWIDPPYRNYKHATHMMDVYEYWAYHKIKAQVVQMISLEGMDVSKLYTHRGFSKHEETYIKEL